MQQNLLLLGLNLLIPNSLCREVRPLLFYFYLLLERLSIFECARALLERLLGNEGKFLVAGIEKREGVLVRHLE